MTLHFKNDVANDAESTQKSKITSLECSTMGKLINRIPGLHLLISSLPSSALRTHVESLGKPRNVNMRSQSLPVKQKKTKISLKILNSGLTLKTFTHESIIPTLAACKTSRF